MEGIKEKMDDIARAIESSTIKMAFKVVEIKSIEGSNIIFLVNSKFQYGTLHKQEVVSMIEAALKKVFDVALYVKFELGIVEVKEKDNSALVNDAMRIFSS